MSDDVIPVVYIFHGEDEFAIAQLISEKEKEMGDPAIASMNISRLDGRNLSLDELYTTAAAIPFLGDRRMVVVNDLINTIDTPELQEKLIKYLENLPPTTRLVLVENTSLLPKKDHKTDKQKSHWLVAWAEQAPKIAYAKNFPILESHALAERIKQQAIQAGGSITDEAAGLLADLCGENPRMAHQEILKLLIYVNYKRPIDADDVRDITPDASVLEKFALANALRERNVREALRVVCKELENTEPYMLVASIAYQFRTLLCARDGLDRGGDIRSLAREMKISEGYARHLFQQAQRFSSGELEDIYRRLLKVDEAIKTSQMDGDVALQYFISDFARE
ncbi:MAG: DNA polymerase III subunit delta [Anaerolineales bacterium]|nr:DNA polymerase III subunit delta [Anaerolineales bacterium]